MNLKRLFQNGLLLSAIHSLSWLGFASAMSAPPERTAQQPFDPAVIQERVQGSIRVDAG